MAEKIIFVSDIVERALKRVRRAPVNRALPAKVEAAIRSQISKDLRAKEFAKQLNFKIFFNSEGLILETEDARSTNFFDGLEFSWDRDIDLKDLLDNE